MVAVKGCSRSLNGLLYREVTVTEVTCTFSERSLLRSGHFYRKSLLQKVNCYKVLTVTGAVTLQNSLRYRGNTVTKCSLLIGGHCYRVVTATKWSLL